MSYAQCWPTAIYAATPFRPLAVTGCLVASCWLLVVSCCAETQLGKYLSFVRHLPAMIMCFMFTLWQRHGKLFTGIESARAGVRGS